MSSFDSFDGALRLFEEMDGLADEFIEESMLPDSLPQAPAKSKGQFFRFLSSGVGVAILCGVVSVGILTALIHMGLSDGNMAGDLVPPQQSPPAENGPMDYATDEPVSLPDESDRVPAGTRSEDESGLYYISYGDGTCICMGFVRDEGQTALAIPDYSPDGDAVVAIYSYAFRNCMTLQSVTLPAGLRSLDHKTFPMEAPIYRIHGNILYLGSDQNPYMVAVATADGRPGATSLHPATRILACHALTYDVGAYFSLVWKDQMGAYEDDPVFTLPKGLEHIGEYSLLDVGRDVFFEGYLVAWDSLTEGGYKDLIRTPNGDSITVTCPDGSTASTASEIRRITLDATAYYADGVLFGGYDTYTKCMDPLFYDWLADPEAFTEAPDQFITVSSIFGDTPRTLTPDELASVAFVLSAGATDEALQTFVTDFNRDPAALYRGKTVVMIPLECDGLGRHTVRDVTVRDRSIHVTVAAEDTASRSEGQRFLLIPVPDEAGALQGATVTYTLLP